MKRIRGPLETDFGLLVAHIRKSYEDHFKVKMYFNGVDGKAVKRILGNFGFVVSRALWDEFVAKDWSWYNEMGHKIQVPHDVKNFERKLSLILEDGVYKKRMRTDERAKEKAPEVVFKKIPGRNGALDDQKQPKNDQIQFNDPIFINEEFIKKK